MMKIDMRTSQGKKTVALVVNELILNIYGPIELALPEMKATGARILAVGNGNVNGCIKVDIDEREKALKLAEDLVANGWEWA